MTACVVLAAALLAQACEAARFTLRWSDNSTNETGFTIERATGSSGAFAQIATTAANTTSYLDASLAAGTLYRYRVRAFNAAGHSAYSNVASGTTAAAGGTTRPPVNTAPTISAIANRTIPAGSTSGPIPFTVGDAETQASSLTVTASSSNQTLLPNARLVLAGSGGSRSITVTPAAGQTGTASVTIAVRDASLSTATSFAVTVTSTAGTGNTPPTISTIGPRTVPANGTTGALTFTVGDAQTSAGNLILTGSSSHPAVVPTENISFGGSGARRTVTVRPLPNTTGITTIAITVSDGALRTTATFPVTVHLPLKFGDIGSPKLKGSASSTSSRFEIDAAGSDIGGAFDQFHYGRQYIQGDAELTVRLDSLARTSASAKAGLMFRGSLSARSPFVLLCVTPSGGVSLQYRSASGASALTRRTEAGAAPRWLKLTRVKNTFYAYHSSDGSRWTFLDSVTVKLPKKPWGGLAVTSGKATARVEAVFSSLSLD